MEIDKYKATLIGLVTTAICLLIHAMDFAVVPVFLIFILLFNISILPLNYFGEWVFGRTNYFMIESTVLVGEFILLVILCVIYFRKLIRSERQREKFNTTWLVVFFVFLQFIVHPIGLYSWLITYNGDHGDPMTSLYGMETFPYSGCSFIVFGIVIDVVRSKMVKKT